ncbi:protein GVQW3-like [Rhipicephalus sanguineus]|uniref:protein GVQW3-like n=1 Tax=Rhipicephalus sanguineus TaxID=34632 RepID=UPI0018961BAA|nr:protein GVQW3-like [Rhipicephalus sanguineus]
MTERLEQRYCIKFCQKLGDSQVETIGNIKTAFGDDAMSRTQIKEWYNRFKDGRTSVESEPRSGRPSTCRNDQVIAEVNAVVMRDRRVTIREIAEEVGISTFSAHSIMTEDLVMKRVAAKFVPKLLTVEQKQLRVEVSQDMLDFTSSDPNFMNTIITGDESWVYGYDPETKSQSSQWKHSTSPRPKKARQVRSNVKVMLSTFFDFRGVVDREYAPQGQTITKEYYRDVLRHLRDAVRRKRPELWSTGNWRIHAPAHSSHLVQTFLAKSQTPLVQQAPYSPDMAPCDFWLFPKLKRTLRGERFQTREDIMAATTAELNSIPKEAFSECFQQWQHRWEKCVESQGDYFEGD